MLEIPRRITLAGFLTAAALLVTLSILLKALIDVDTSWDTWMYHLPFAARIWGIVPPETYLMNNGLEHRFEGFPLVGEFLQGLLWLVSRRPETVNLVAFLSLLAYLGVLRRYLRIPLYLSALALLAIPLVQIQATSAYVDLPGSLAASTLILMTYLLYVRPDFATRRNLLVMFAAAAFAANTKFHLIPVVFVVLCFAAYRLVRCGLQQPDAAGRPRRLPRGALPVAGLALVLIFATPIKNLALHGNPFYPVRLSVAGVTLNGAEDPYRFVPPYLEAASKPQRWLYSLLEVGIRPITHPRRWTIDQYMPPESRGNRMGGYFGAYVVFHLALLAYVGLRLRSRESNTAVAALALLSAFTIFMPQAHELRYYLYWMVTLVSLNLYLVTRLEAAGRAPPWLGSRSLGVASLLALSVVVAGTRGQYVKPSFYSFATLKHYKVEPELLHRLRDGDKVCFYKEPWTFLYASTFHGAADYSLKEGLSPQGCSGYKFLY